MMQSYQDLFNQRGSAYDRAMQAFPGARDAEFKQVVTAAHIEPGMIVADVPAGGGYLRHYLPPGCVWRGHEPCASFTNHGARQETAVPLVPLPWADESIDAAISLAGVHHIDDKIPLFTDLYRVVKPGGHLAVSDVAAGSAIAAFLDGYVGAHNSTGHQGVYLDLFTLEELTRSGWVIKEAGVQRFHWAFASRSVMAQFCHSLFDLRTSSEADTQNAIETILGVDDLPDGRVGMCWELTTIFGVRGSPSQGNVAP